MSSVPLQKVRCERILCLNKGKYELCFAPNAEIMQNSCGKYARVASNRMFAREPKVYSYEDMQNLNMAELNELKRQKLTEFADLQAEKEILMANIMSIQNMIKKEQIDNEKNSSN